MRAQGRTAVDQGPAAAALELSYVTLLLKPSSAQQATLEQLLDEQQSSWSPNFHKWLTPEQYADRFGLSSGDIGKITSWLKSEGLTVNDVSRGRQWITFTGGAQRIGAAFHTEIRRYLVEGETGYANASEPSVPTALAGVVAGLHGLDTIPERKGPRIVPFSAPEFNSGGSHYMAPDDFATIYNVKALYQSGIDGTGQKIAIIGRTDINLADIRSFRTRFNLPAKDPEVVLFGPDPGTNFSDQGEANLDVEWSGAVARNATIIYVNSTSVRTSAQYAVDNNLAPVMSFSYGGCEQQNSTAFRSIAQQAAAQGISWMVSSGDSGATTCDAAFSARQATKGLAVSFPASIPEVTAVGGTMFDEGTGNYWATSNDGNFSSALSYIPERAWNESGARGLASGGGGASIFFPKPAWQSGFGVPSSNARLVPDLSFAAASHDGYLVNIGGVTFVVSGTSASAPAFAGIVALLNQYLVGRQSLQQPGLGNINPALYRLAQTTTNVFHDTTVGDNLSPCAQSAPDCVDGFSGYRAGPGYDQATGLGSVDAYEFVMQWNTSVGNTTTSLTTDPSSVDLNGALKLTASVTVSGSGLLSGSVSFVCVDNHTTLGSVDLVVTGATGTASLTVPANLLPIGNDTIQAVYTGNANVNGSSGSAAVAVTAPPSGSSVTVTFSPNPVYQNRDGSWSFSIVLREGAGVAATLTNFTIEGTARLDLFSNTAIPAKGTLSTSIRSTGLQPATRTFGFAGTDASGQSWSQTVGVPFLGQGTVFPAMTLLSAANAVQQNPEADALCQWSQPLYLQELSGFSVQLTRLFAGTTDLSNQIQNTFGTTHLAPFGTLLGSLCLSGISAPLSQSASVAGTPDIGGTLTAGLTTAYSVAAATPSHASVSPTTVSMGVADASQSASAIASLDFDTGSPGWTASIFPPGRTTSWLRVSSTSGTGSSKLTLTASGAGLSKGVYDARLVIRMTNTIPQYLSLPISFAVGVSPTTSISSVSSAFSGRPALAPGMAASAYGTNLSPGEQHAPSVPWPYSMQGVSATVNGVSAPLLHVLNGQINFQVPYETSAGMAVVGINNNGKVASFFAPVKAASPDPWPYFISSAGVVGTARQGAILVTFVTGEGDVTRPLANGATPTAVTPQTNPRLPVTLTVGGVPAVLLYSAIPPGIVGITQINFEVPPNAPLGVQPVVISVGGEPGPPVNLTVTP